MSVELESLIARLRLDTSGLASGMAAAQSTLATAGAKMTSTGSTMTRGLTLPLVGIAAAGVNLAASFDKTMRQVAIATGGPTGALKKLAIQMGAETQFSANDASQAMLELAKSGMTAATIQGGALEETMRLASAGGVDLASASTYVANTMATFGLKAKDAGKVTTALAGAANASSASVESLGLGLAQGALAARNAGLSLQETTGVLSLFDAQGLKGADAGTSLKSMLNALTPASTKAKDAMKSLGLEFTDGQGHFKSIGGVADELKTKLSGLTEVQRAQALETIFGSDGVRAATLLMNGGSKAVEKYTKASRDQKTTSELANAAMEGTSGALERAKGSLETAALVIGDVLAPHVETVAGFIEDMANKFASLSGKTQGFIVAGAAVAAILGPLLVVLGMVATALAAVSLPVVAVVAGLALLAVALVKAYKSSATFRALVQTAFAGISAFVTTTFLPALARIGVAFQNLMTVLAPIVAQIVAVIGEHMPEMVALVSQAFETLRTIITTVLEAIRVQTETLTAVISFVWQHFGDTILAIISAVFGVIVGVIKGALKIIQGIFNVIGGVLTGDWRQVWTGIKQILSGAWTAIFAVLKGAFGVMKALFSAAWGAVKSVVSSAWGAIKGAVSGGAQAVLGAVKGGWDAVKSATSNAWTAVKDAVATGILQIVAVLGSLPRKAKAALSALVGMASGIGSDMMNGLINAVKAAAGKVADAAVAVVKGALDKAKSFLHIGSPSKKFYEVGSWSMEGFALGIRAKTKDVGDAGEAAGKAAKDGAEKHKATLERVGKLLSDGFAQGIVGGRAHVVKVMAQLMDAVTKTHNEKAAELVASATKTLKRLGARYDALQAELKKAQGKLANLQADESAFNARHSALGDAGGDLGSLDLPDDVAPSADNITAALEKAAGVAAQFDDTLAALKAAGLSQDALDQLIAKGPEAALATAQAILSGGTASIARINALQSQIAAAGESIRAKGSAAMFAAAQSMQQGIIDGLDSKMGEVADKMAEVAQHLVKALKKALKIKSPSRVLEGLGAFTALGFAKGIEGTTNAVRAAADNMAQAALVAPSQAASAAAAPGATGESIAPQIRVFIGDRELTDMVRVEVGGVLAPLKTAMRTGAIT